jgi:ActR/RegA family two-component response regulator
MASLSVLLIDDDAAVHRAVRLRLRRSASLSYCQNAETAVELVKIRKFDVALVDVNLGETISGPKLISLLHEIDPALTPIIFTAYADYQTAIASIEAHSFDFISKSLADDDTFIEKIIRAGARTREQREKDSNHRDAGLLRTALTNATINGELKIGNNDIQRGLLGDSLESFSILLGRIELLDSRLKERGASVAGLDDLARYSDETLAELQTYVGRLRDYFSAPERVGRSVNEVLAHAAKALRDGSPELVRSRRIECGSIKPDQAIPTDGCALFRAVVILSRLLLESAPAQTAIGLKPSLVFNPSVELNLLKNRPDVRILHALNFSKEDRMAVAIEISGSHRAMDVEKLSTVHPPGDQSLGETALWGALAMVARLNGALMVEAKAGSCIQYRILFRV